MAITIQELLQIAVENDASDLHITTHIPPRIRVNILPCLRQRPKTWSTAC